MTKSLSFTYEPRLIEEAVFLTERNGVPTQELKQQRQRLYEIADPDERERQFAQLYEAWFNRLTLAQPIVRAFREQPLMMSEIRGCVVGRAIKAADEGAELFVRAGQGPDQVRRCTVGLLLRPESLLAPDRLLTFLRREFFHISDMLDPAYGYKPALPSTGVGPVYDQLLINRYRLLWEITIDGRMSRLGWLAKNVRSEHLARFQETFPVLESQTHDLFALFFDRETHTHQELVAFASNPQGASSVGQPVAGSRCPVCGFPTHSFEARADELASGTILAIQCDFPEWKPSAGICRQCADLYRARNLSLRAASLLPRPIL